MTAQAQSSGVDALAALVGDDLTKVNQAILDRMHSQVALIPQLASHIIAAGGKRLRPLVTLGAARLAGYEGERHIGLAACVEFIHTATLLHDDVVDDSDLRRGRDSANSLWGNKPSVLVGDFLFSRAFELLVADGSLKVLATLSHASSTLAEGEVLQLMTANDTETDEDAYMEVIRYKTAQLFAAAARIGAEVAERPQAEEKALERFGLDLGLAFQLTDDVLDYSAKQEALGKSIGDDFHDGKVTLPVVLAFQRGDAEEKAFWRRVLEDQKVREDDLAHAMTLLNHHGTLDETLERARAHARDGRAALAETFADGPYHRALADALDFAVERAF